MKPTVLIVDDVPAIRDRLHLLLQEDFEVIGEAADGVSALLLIRNRVPDIVVLDLVMPRMSGLTTIKKIFAEHAHPPIIIVLSGVKDEKTILAAFQAGATEYLSKPIDEKRLVEVIRTLLKNRAT